MKKMLFAILCGLSLYCPLSAQIDSMFYFVDKTTLANDIVLPYNNSSLWALNNGHYNQIIQTKDIGSIYDGLNEWAFGTISRISKDSLLAN